VNTFSGKYGREVIMDECKRPVRKICQQCLVVMATVHEDGTLVIMKCPKCQCEYWYLRTCKPIWEVMIR
jgi:hypothetical protein